MDACSDDDDVRYVSSLSTGQLSPFIISAISDSCSNKCNGDDDEIYTVCI